MPQSLAQIYLHLVFSTKDRRPHLQHADELAEMHCFLGGECNRFECPPVIVGGVADHVHILCRFGRSVSVKDLIKELKRESSIWVKQRFPSQSDFYWQHGYGAFSVSPGHVEALTAYIATQEEHHRAVSFQDEFRRLLTKYRVEWDEAIRVGLNGYGTPSGYKKVWRVFPG